MRDIILNADDCGYDARVNQAIFELLGLGLISSTTLLANGLAIEEALARVGDFPGASFGVHLNITQFTPLSGHPGLAPLLNEGGAFAQDPRRITMDAGLRAAILAEWSAQIERVRQAGVAISHLDSHHHLHTVPALFGVLKTLQDRFGILRVRNTRNLYAAPQVLPDWRLRLKKGLWSQALRRWPPLTLTTDFFTDLTTFVILDRAGCLTPRGSFELMVHPGSVNSTYETRLLQDSHPLDREGGIPHRLISYHQLGR
ncbi:MAG: ChbG/HpnK family deacetylase [Magnetococcales bacterium]|nr:ChbG/HpnK family deacetylase [Magnetococcales bacterium]